MHPISLSAPSIGHLAQSSLAATAEYAVHSSFTHALNLVAQEGGWLTLVDAASGNLPSGARVITPPGWDWRAHAQPGERITVRGTRLIGATWQLELAGASCWRPAARCAWIAWPSQRVVSARHACVAVRLEAHCAKRMLHGALQWLPGWPANARPVHLSVHDDVAELATTVRALVGFGGGLTPDGDDYLLGYLAALCEARGWPLVDAHREALSTILRTQLNRTNDISRHYLQLALDGHFSEPVDRFLAIASDTDDYADIAAAADAVMQWGASSGVDCLAGMLHGMRAWQDAWVKGDAKESTLVFA